MSIITAIQIVDPIAGAVRAKLIRAGTPVSEIGTQVYVNGLAASPDYHVQLGDKVVIAKGVEDPFSIAVAVSGFVASSITSTGLVTSATLASTLAWVATGAVGAGLLYGAYTGLSYLMQSLMPGHSSPGSDPGNSSQTYAWDGIQTTSNVDIPVAVVYGEHYVGGNYISAYITQEEGRNSNEQEQYMNVLLALGEGELQEIAGFTEDTDSADIDTIGDSILIDGEPISNYRNADVYIRMGSDVQPVIPYFEELHDVVSLDNVELTRNTEVVRTTDGGELSALELRFRHAGLAEFTDTGIDSKKVRVEVYYREYEGDDDTWIYHGLYTRRGRTQSRLDGIYRIDGLTPGRYEVRLIKKTKDSRIGERLTDTFLDAIDEITDKVLTYPNTALVGIRLLATDQLSGTLGNVEVLVKGKKVRQYFDSGSGASGESGSLYTYDTGWTQNPIWCIVDMLMSDQYGLGLTEDQIDIPEAIASAAYCDQLVTSDFLDPHERFKLDMVIDSDYKGYEAIQAMAASCRTFFVWADGKVKVITERPQTISHIFGMGNIIQGSWKKTFMSRNKKLNSAEVQFLDKDNQYKRDSILVYSSESAAQNETSNKHRAFIRGITRRAQALRMANYIIKQSRSIIRSIEFETSLDGLTVIAGDVIGVGHDVPQYGIASGRVKGGTSSTITLRDRVTLPELGSGETHIIRVQHADNSIETKTITSPDNATYAPGDSISIDGTWDTTPETFDVYHIGTSTVGIAEYRVTSISRNMMGNAVVNAIEYDADIYDDTDAIADVQTHTELPDPMASPQHVTDLVASSENSYYPVVEVSWRILEPTSAYGFHKFTIIEISEDGGLSYREAARSKINNVTLYGLQPLKTYYIRAVAVSTREIRAPIATAPTTQHVPSPPAVGNVTGLEIKGQGIVTTFNTVDCTFAWRPVASGSAVHPAGQEPAGAGSGSEDDAISGYRVNIYVQDYPDPVGGYESGTSGAFTSALTYDPLTWHQVRTQFVTQPEFSYKLSDNTSDNGSPRRRFAVGVRAVDKYGQISPQENVISVVHGLFTTQVIAYDPAASLTGKNNEVHLSAEDVAGGSNNGMVFEVSKLGFEDRDDYLYSEIYFDTSPDDHDYDILTYGGAIISTTPNEGLDGPVTQDKRYMNIDNEGRYRFVLNDSTTWGGKVVACYIIPVSPYGDKGLVTKAIFTFP